MSARYVFKVGPVNRNADYANEVTVLADNYIEARAKAITFRGFKPADTGTWLIRIDEVAPDIEVLEKLAKLINEKDGGK